MSETVFDIASACIVSGVWDDTGKFHLFVRPTLCHADDVIRCKLQPPTLIPTKLEIQDVPYLPLES